MKYKYVKTELNKIGYHHEYTQTAGYYDMLIFCKNDNEIVVSFSDTKEIEFESYDEDVCDELIISSIDFSGILSVSYMSDDTLDVMDSLSDDCLYIKGSDLELLFDKIVAAIDKPHNIIELVIDYHKLITQFHDAIQPFFHIIENCRYDFDHEMFSTSGGTNTVIRNLAVVFYTKDKFLSVRYDMFALSGRFVYCVQCGNDHTVFNTIEELQVLLDSCEYDPDMWKNMRALNNK